MCKQKKKGTNSSKNSFASLCMGKVVENFERSKFFHYYLAYPEGACPLKLIPELWDIKRNTLYNSKHATSTHLNHSYRFNSLKIVLYAVSNKLQGISIRNQVPTTTRHRNICKCPLGSVGSSVVTLATRQMVTYQPLYRGYTVDSCIFHCTSRNTVTYSNVQMNFDYTQTTQIKILKRD